MTNVHEPKWHHYYHFFEIILLSFCITLAANTHFNLAIPWALILLEVLLFSVIVAFLDHNRMKLFSFILLIGCTIIIIFLTYSFKINLIQYGLDTNEWFQSFYYLQGTYNFYYAFYMVLGMAFLTSLCTYCLQKFKATQLFLTLSILTILVYFALQKILLSKWVILMGLAYCGCTLTELAHQLKDKAHWQSHKNASAFLLPFSLLITLLVILLPTPSTPISWKWVTDFATKVSGAMDDLVYEIQIQLGSANDEFILDINGFNTSDSTSLGGKIIDGNDVLLDLSAKEIFKNPIYLKGSIYNVYTGHTWEKEALPSLSDYNEFELDCYENLYSLYRSKITSNEQIFHLTHVELTYGMLRTKTLFWPNSTHAITQKGSQKKLNLEGANILFANTKKRNFSYELFFTEINAENEVFSNYIRSLNTFHYNARVSASGPLDLSSLNDNALFYQVSNSKNFKDFIALNTTLFSPQVELLLRRRAFQIQEAYTSLPDSVPLRIYALAHEITKDAPTTYDKLKAIEAYLRQFTYTKSPTLSSQDQDFVEAFLFDAQEGYCTYFASAMAVLARCVDIPTRYVEGLFVVPESYSRATYPLTNQALHAWPEAYIEGYGWLTFEPTPGYNLSSANRWSTNDPSDTTPYPSMYLTPPDTAEPDKTLKSISSVQKKNLHISLIVLLLVGLLLLFTLYMCYIAWRYYKKLKNGDSTQKAKLLLIEILFYLEKKGYKRASSESLWDYAHHISENSFIAHESTLENIISTYLAYRYGKHTVNDEELDTLYNYRQFLYDQLKGRFRRIKCLIFKISFLLKNYNTIA